MGHTTKAVASPNPLPLLFVYLFTCVCAHACDMWFTIIVCVHVMCKLLSLCVYVCVYM